MSFGWRIWRFIRISFMCVLLANLRQRRRVRKGKRVAHIPIGGPRNDDADKDDLIRRVQSADLEVKKEVLEAEHNYVTHGYHGHGFSPPLWESTRELIDLPVSSQRP